MGRHILELHVHITFGVENGTHRPDNVYLWPECCKLSEYVVVMDESHMIQLIASVPSEGLPSLLVFPIILVLISALFMLQ